MRNRGSVGVINMKCNKKSGDVADILPIEEATDVILTTKNGQFIRFNVDSVRECNRNTTGVIICRLEDDRVHSIMLS